DVVEAALLAGADDLLAAGQPVEVGRVPEVEVRRQRREARVPVVAAGALVDPDDVGVPGVGGGDAGRGLGGRGDGVVYGGGGGVVDGGVGGGGGAEGGGGGARGEVGVGDGEGLPDDVAVVGVEQHQRAARRGGQGGALVAGGDADGDVLADRRRRAPDLRARV